MKKDKKHAEQAAEADIHTNATTAETNETNTEAAEMTETKVDEVAQLKEELASAKDQNLRLYAEFENFKRRNAKERLELMSAANRDVIEALLPIVDDFERAIKNISRTDENKSLFEGVDLIYQKLTDTLKQKGLKPMESSIGTDFNVERMEAITRLPVPDKKQHGKVIDEVERGYHLGDKVLRYARVVVAHHE
jgi:molecular chaperone GrpE